MLRIPSFRAGLPVFKALSSETRLSIMELLQQEGPLSITAIAEKLKLTAGTLTPHIRALQDCGLISVSMTEGKHGTLKICSVAVSSIVVSSPELSITENMYEMEIGIGQYTNYEVMPTCGICTPDHIIGQVDVPRVFFGPGADRRAYPLVFQGLCGIHASLLPQGGPAAPGAADFHGDLLRSPRRGGALA